ncbi:DUF1206 domain-containing protein [Aeromicrobium sp. Sec7.5]|uniref:DUF1206 domain-containing protein n=1 Tax=Aeromicrobium sp. Sec7.5 TaxID=3121276 RepID=UPI002FE47B19
MGSTAEHAGHQARHSEALKRGARVGLAAYGLVHLLIAWIALQVAWSGGGDASSDGALRKLAGQPFGQTVLWVTAVSLVALVLWQVATAVSGYQSEDGFKRTRKRLAAAGRVVVYSVLALSAFKFAAGSGGSSGSDSKEEGLTADLLSAPAGRVLVIIVAIAILAVAARQVHRGWTDSFVHDLDAGASTGQAGSLVLVVGRTGYVAKGVAIGVVGVLFGWAATSYDPDKAGGLDDALKTVRDQPFGPYLLTGVALGLAAFGLYCFAWARYARTR